MHRTFSAEADSSPEQVHDSRYDRARQIVIVVACIWVAVGAGTTLIGWQLGSERWINFPIPARYGTMLPVTAVNLLLITVALWLLRSESVLRGARWIANSLVAATMATSVLVLTEYTTGLDLGLDLTLFAETVREVVPRLPGRPTVTSSVCFLALGLAVFMLDMPSRIAHHVSELLLLVVMFVGGERLISFVFGQTGLWTAASRLFSEPVLIPMAPWTASCLLVLGLGFLFSRPTRGLVGLYLARGAGGLLARRILPAAIVLPIVFGWLGLEATRIAPQTVYPLSLVVSFQIAFLLIVITRNAREFERIDAERRRAEEALVERERLLSAVFDNAGAGIAVVDLEGRPMRTNRTLRNMLGYDGDELARMRFTDITHPGDVALDRELYQDLLRGVRDSYRIEKRFIRKDGRELWVQLDASVSRDVRQRIELIINIVGDVTDRKRLEDAQRFLLDAGGAFSGSLDLDAILHSIAQLSVPYLGDCCEVDLIAGDGTVERAAVARSRPGRPCMVRNRLHPAGKRPNEIVAEVFHSGEPAIVATVTDEWLAKLIRDGRHLDLIRGTRPHSLMVVPVPGRARVQGVISFLMTRPERRYNPQDLDLARELAARAGLALENARLFEESRQATRVRDEVLRVVAHDLRNPLNTIALGADLLHEQLPREPEAAWEGTIDVIQLSVKQADHLIRDLLEVARIQAGKLVIEPEPTDANTIVADAIELHESIAAKRGVKLQPDVPQILPTIHADRPRVLQVFSNLIGNALRFSPVQGTVTVGANAQGNEVRFFVRDNGPGISEADQLHLFEPFWQARAGAGGTGLGLTIARSIVEAHGGRIWTWSRPGKGSIFFFTLPATATAAKAAD